MALSSNSIIHFTNTKDSLKGILEGNFNLKYCKETFHLNNEDFRLAAPMVCFCDIPLSEVKNHINKYGSYGIGLTKEWAERKGLNPVLYLEKNSLLGASIDRIYMNFVDAPEGGLEDLDDPQKSILDVLRYIKNYQSDLNRGGNTIQNYRFSDEREWRYVPPIEEDIPMIIPQAMIEDPDDSAYIEDAKNKLARIKLDFEPNDIKYIIIENDAEISEIVDLLRKAKGNTYSYNDIERLMTRILTTEQIVSDI